MRATKIKCQILWREKLMAPVPMYAKHQEKSRCKNNGFSILAEWTGLEPATPGVTGRYSNQLNYHSW